MTKHMDLDTEKPRKKGFMYPTQTDGNTGFGERERERDSFLGRERSLVRYYILNFDQSCTW